jgi:hypothetical protein
LLPLLCRLLSCLRTGRAVRAPNGIRTRATALKGRRPGPLDDGGGTSAGQTIGVSRPTRTRGVCRREPSKHRGRPPPAPTPTPGRAADDGFARSRRCGHRSRGFGRVGNHARKGLLQIDVAATRASRAGVGAGAASVPGARPAPSGDVALGLRRPHVCSLQSSFFHCPPAGRLRRRGFRPRRGRLARTEAPVGLRLTSEPASQPAGRRRPRSAAPRSPVRTARGRLAAEPG